MSNEITGYVLNPEKIYGKSAYEIALAHGFKGTEEEWLLSLETNSMESIKALKKEVEDDITQMADDVLSIKQTTGDSKTAVMSQDAVTKEFDKIKSETARTSFNGENTHFTFGKFIWSNGREYSSDAMSVSDYITVGGGEKIESMHFSDGNGYTIIDFVCEYRANDGTGYITRTNIENGGSVILNEETRYIRFSFGRGTESGVVLTEDDLRFFNVEMTNFVNGISKSFLQTLHNRMSTTSEDSMDDLTNFGIYGWSPKETPYDCPVGSDSGLLLVVQYSNQNDPNYGRLAQILYTWRGEYTRFRNTTEWTDWQYKGALVTYDGIKINSMLKKCNEPFVPLDDVDTSSIGTPTFLAGKKYRGVPYSARHYDSLDVFYNMTLDALFSMFNHKGTKIYNYTKAGKGGDVFTGGVCSSFVCWITSQPIFYTTWDIIKMLNYKDVNTIEDIEIGDILMCHTTWGDAEDHSMIVSNIITGTNGIIAVEISEMWNPLFRRIIYEASRFMGLLDGTTRQTSSGRLNKYRVGRFDNQKIRTMKDLVINKHLMTEFGNKVYYELGEKIWIASPGMKLRATSPSGVDHYIDTTVLNQRDGLVCINDEYGIDIDEIGEWNIKCQDQKVCKEVLSFKIIKKGSATLSNNRVDLSGYEGCTPCGYAVVGIRKGGDGSYDTHLDDASYTAGRLTIYSKNDPRYAGALASDTLNFNLNMNDVGSPYVGYYVRVFYETGCGQAFQDTNIQYL